MPCASAVSISAKLAEPSRAADSSPEPGESGGLRGGQPGGDVLAHEMHAPLVLLGEETKPACGAVRAQEPVARLPGAQQFGAHTNASAELADAQSWTVGHNWSLPNYTILRKISTKAVH